MAISGDTAASQLISAMGNNSSRIILDKASVASRVAGDFNSLWRSTGQPGQGAIPTSVAACDHTLVGAFSFTQQTAPAKSYLGVLEGLCSIAGTTLEVHDRLAHMGGLSGAVTGAQTVNLDLDALLGTSNLAERIGNANYSDVQWWLEWYTDTGAASPVTTVNVTYDDGSTGNLNSLGSLAATRRAQWLFSLNSFIPAAKSGSYIRGVNSISFSVSTGTAGNLGVTATRYRAAMYKPVANARFTQDWASLGFPEIYNSSCLFGIQIAGGTSTGLVKATGKIVHG